MDLKLFDAHCHLYMPQFDTDRQEVLARMQEAQMGAVVIGVDLASSRAALELTKQHSFLWAAVGLHPNDNPAEEFDMGAYEALAREPRVVAIGECGLDYFRSGGTDEEKSAQKMRFEKHVELAEKVQKPLIIHCRNAHEDMLAILENKKPTVPVIIHFFTGTGELAQMYLDLGCYLSFPGPVTYTDMYDDSMRVVPLDRMLIETDSPYAAPVPNRGKRNEPVYVSGVAEKIAVLKGLEVEKVIAQTVINASSVFNL
ncbi:MAG: sec-independent protein translocase protein TatD DNase family protein [Candidatus Adlerbacteria bacterium]|nr:sec-independent protein translocase protein TatD DNase family protein [Candidatus Adlerbacteria bacterium]